VTTPAIELDRAGKDFVGPDGAPVHAVRDVSLRVADGETVCLIGTSGSGKTTILKMINRLVEPTHGRVLVRGEDVGVADPIELRRGMGYVIQSGGLFPHLTVARNIGLLGEIAGWDREPLRERVRELLALVDLPPDEFAERWPSELSGGQRQRVGVARALVLDPPIVLMDEPFGALDPITRARLREDFVALKAEVGKTVVFVTHDMTEAFAVGDRVAVVNEGRLAQVGTETELRETPADGFVASFLREHFDGDHARG